MTQSDIDTERRMTMLETNQTNNRERMDAGFKALDLSIRELKILVKQESDRTREEANSRFENLEVSVSANTKFREKIHIYAGLAAITFGVIFTYLKDIMNWLFGK